MRGPRCWTFRLQVTAEPYDPLAARQSGAAAAQPAARQGITLIRQVELPRHSRKRFHFVLPLGAEIESIRVLLYGQEGSEAGKTVALRGSAVGGGIVLGLSRTVFLDFLSLLDWDAVEAPDRRRVVYLHPELLPESWYGYDGVEMVVLHEAPLKQLSENQLGALERWLFAGGVLVVSGGPHLSKDRARRLAPLLLRLRLGALIAPGLRPALIALLVLAFSAGTYLWLHGRLLNSAAVAVDLTYLEREPGRRK